MATSLNIGDYFWIVIYIFSILFFIGAVIVPVLRNEPVDRFWAGLAGFIAVIHYLSAIVRTLNG